MDHFGQYAEHVAAVARDLSSKQKEKLPELARWAASWRKLYDNWEDIRRRDPMIAYRPKHKAAFDFHSSLAFWRYFMAGNGTSKTTSGYAEHYFITTNQHKWRHIPFGRHSTFIVGLAYKHYAPGVFEKKFISGEEGNYLSPIFPEGGKWLRNYDDRKHIITVACRECAEGGKAGSCRHDDLQSQVKLFSDESGWEELQGTQHILGHFDEHVDERWKEEAKQRVIRVPFGGMQITGSPLFGTHAWEIRDLKKLADGNPADNLAERSGLGLCKVVEIFNIDQFSAGIVPHNEIRLAMKSMDDFEIEARVWGRPAPATKNPVFDRFILAEMRKRATPGACWQLRGTVDLEKVAGAEHIEITKLPPRPDDPNDKWTGLRVWEGPEPAGQYILAVDSARGVTDGDASCASVIKLSNVGMRLHLTLVAQFHGWLNAFDYADEVFKIAVLYNSALVVVELTGGFGDPVVLRLKNTFCYWNLHRDAADHALSRFTLDPRLGIDTNAQSKPFMVAALQQFVRDRCINIPCCDTIDEMANFAQENVGKDGTRLVTPRFQGAGGAHDDRVMSLVIGASVAVSTPVFDFQADAQRSVAMQVAPDIKAATESHQELQ